MPRARRVPATERMEPPSTTFEGRENQLVNLASNLAERQLREGTASSQVIVHYLRLGTTRERLEQERLRQENELLRVKADTLEAQRHDHAVYEEALKMFRVYSGADDGEDIYDEN